MGSHLCDHLLLKWHDVICTDNLVTGSARNIEHIIELLIKRDYMEFSEEQKEMLLRE
ncbi:MAG: hypothetical protein ACT6FG_05575 [Methanosarcinaceae archaeon]